MEISSLRDEARDLLGETVALRRTLHQWPELGNDLPITRESVLGALEGLPLDITLHETTSGIAAVLDGGKPGPTVLLRGEEELSQARAGVCVCQRWRLRLCVSVAGCIYL